VRCYARTCGTCWTCTAAAEQLRAIAERDRVAKVATLPADLQALFVELRASGMSDELAERVAERWFTP